MSWSAIVGWSSDGVRMTRTMLPFCQARIGVASASPGIVSVAPSSDTYPRSTRSLSRASEMPAGATAVAVLSQ